MWSTRVRLVHSWADTLTHITSRSLTHTRVCCAAWSRSHTHIHNLKWATHPSLSHTPTHQSCTAPPSMQRCACTHTYNISNTSNTHSFQQTKGATHISLPHAHQLNTSNKPQVSPSHITSRSHTHTSVWVRERDRVAQHTSVWVWERDVMWVFERESEIKLHSPQVCVCESEIWCECVWERARCYMLYVAPPLTSHLALSHTHVSALTSHLALTHTQTCVSRPHTHTSVCCAVWLITSRSHTHTQCVCVWARCDVSARRGHITSRSHPPKNGQIALQTPRTSRLSTFYYCQVVNRALLRLLSTYILV